MESSLWSFSVKLVCQLRPGTTAASGRRDTHAHLSRAICLVAQSAGAFRPLHVLSSSSTGVLTCISKDHSHLYGMPLMNSVQAHEKACKHSSCSIKTSKIRVDEIAICCSTGLQEWREHGSAVHFVLYLRVLQKTQRLCKALHTQIAHTHIALFVRQPEGSRYSHTQMQWSTIQMSCQDIARHLSHCYSKQAGPLTAIQPRQDCPTW